MLPHARACGSGSSFRPTPPSKAKAFSAKISLSKTLGAQRWSEIAPLRPLFWILWMPDSPAMNAGTQPPEGVTETTFTTGTRTATPAPDVELSDLTVSHVKVEGKYRITVNATVRGPTLPADPDLMLELSHEGTVFQVTTSQAVPVGGDTTRILQGGRMLELDDLPDEICVTATAINVAGARGESDTLCAESERSGGCASLSAPPTWLLAGLPLLVLARRRR